jgi:hypothetical protein
MSPPTETRCLPSTFRPLRSRAIGKKKPRRGRGSKYHFMRRTEVRARPIDRPDPPRNSPERFANCAAAQ